MSPVVLGLDLLLVSLLVLTLILGVRLNGRLKSLKQSHAGFEKAVAELNEAAARAEAGLAALRETSTEAHDALFARIETAKALATRLERANFQAERAAEAVGKAKAELPSLAASRADAAAARSLLSSGSSVGLSAPSPSFAGAPSGGAPFSNALATIAALVGDSPRSDAPRSETSRPEPRGGGSSSARRGRPAFDEDLFEDGEPSEASRFTHSAPPGGVRGRPKDDRR